jgi:TIR domain-containing protein
MPTHPTAFVSYSWDDDDHKEWVKALATQLRRDAVDVRLDQWHSVPGNQLPHFMESEIRLNDFVIIICTPKYKVKSDTRTGGVGYEGDIMTAEVFTKQNHLKFIPILARGTWEEAAPTWLVGTHYIDLREARYKVGYKDLLETLLQLRQEAPLLGPLPPTYGGPARVNQGQERSVERANDFYQYAIGRFSTIVHEEQLDITGLGFLDIVLVFDGSNDRKWYNDDRFISALIAAYPNPMFSPSYIFRTYQGDDSKLRPYTIGNTYEQLFFLTPQWSPSWAYADFTIFDPDGSFFVRKAFPEDVWRDYAPSKGQFLEPVFHLLLISESFVIGSQYAQALGYGTETNMFFSIRWSGIRGRLLKGLLNGVQRMDYYGASTCRDTHVQLGHRSTAQPSK